MYCLFVFSFDCALGSVILITFGLANVDMIKKNNNKKHNHLMKKSRPRHEIFFSFYRHIMIFEWYLQILILAFEFLEQSYQFYRSTSDTL
jgi:hypothetical protein